MPGAVHWRQALPGQWALTDDGYATECLKIRAYGEFTEHVFSIGRCTNLQKRPFLWSERKETRDWSGFRPWGWKDREAQRKRTKRAVQAYVQMTLTGYINWEILGNIYRPDQKKPAATVKRLFKEKEIQDMVQRELAAVLQQKGITQEFVLDTLKKAIDVAENADNANALLKSVEIMSEMLDMMPQHTKMSIGVMQQLGPVDESDIQHIEAMREPDALPASAPDPDDFEDADLLKEKEPE